MIIETSSGYGRDLLSGIIRFMRMHDEWSVFCEQRDLTKDLPSWLTRWKGDGIISRATTPELVKAVEKTAVPLVELTDRGGDAAMPHVRSDDEAIGAMAAEHLLERGFAKFGFCGYRKEAWSKRRETAFRATVHKAGATCDVYESPWHGPSAKSWQEEQSCIKQWVGSLSPPFAVMACNDVRGQQVLDACSSAALSVPEQVAVIGVDNEELLCRMSAPPLSSVIPNAESVGFRAAELLDALMKGQSVPSSAQLLPPIAVATRQSTDVVAIDDRDVAAALRYIRENACRGLTVNDVVRNSPVSRSTLERALRKYLGRTPQQEIRSVQIKRVRELLATTNLSVEQIAPLCGFDHPEYLHVVFKRVTGTTPGEFRLQSLGQYSARPC